MSNIRPALREYADKLATSRKYQQSTDGTMHQIGDRMLAECLVFENDLCDHLARVTAELEAANKDRLDAERYRWLRGDLCGDHSLRWTQWEVRCWRAPQWTADLRRTDLDAAIDADRLRDSALPSLCKICGGAIAVHRADGEYLGECPECSTNSAPEGQS